MTPPTASSENAGVGVSVTVRPSPVTWDWILCEMSSLRPKTSHQYLRVVSRLEGAGQRQYQVEVLVSDSPWSRN